MSAKINKIILFLFHFEEKKCRRARKTSKKKVWPNYLGKSEILPRKKKCSELTDLILIKKINNTDSFFKF